MTQQTNGVTPTPVPVMSQEILDGITFEDHTSETPEQNPSPEPAPVAPAPAPVTDPVPAVVETPAPAPQEPAKVLPPTRHENESEIQFNLRTQLFMTGQAKANAESDEEKTILGKEMRRIRESLSKAGNPAPITTPQPTPNPAAPVTTPPADDKTAALEALKQLGVPTLEELDAILEKRLSERLSQQDIVARISDQIGGIKDFYKSRPDIESDPVKQVNFENHFMELFKDKLPSMSKQVLAQTLDMTASYLYPKVSMSKVIDNTQTKIDALNISGGSVAEASKIDNATREKLKSEGWSDEQINTFSV